MKRWPIRRRMTLWTAIIAGLAVFCFGIGVAWHLYNDGIGNLDRELSETSHDFFDLLEKRGESFDWASTEDVQDLFPNVRSLFFIEVAEPETHLVYRSPNLKGAHVPADPNGRDYYTSELVGKSVRVGVFQRGPVALRLAASIYQVEETFEDLLIAYALAMPLVLILVAFAGWWFSKRALLPIAEIASAAENITARRLDQRLPASGSNDEVAHLTEVLNKMIGGLSASFAQATRFTADASHELKTPLTIIRGELEAALRDADLSPKHERLLVNLLEETGRLRGITDGLLLLSRADAGHFHLEKTPLDLSALLLDMLEDVEILAAPHEIEVRMDVRPGATVLGNEQFLRQLLLNLFENAIKYNLPGGVIRVALTRGETECAISIVNTSRGIPPEDGARIFDRFYRGEASAETRREGHGLGLSICREIARAHDGEIVVDPSPQPGWTEFRVTFPSLCSSEVEAVSADAMV